MYAMSLDTIAAARPAVRRPPLLAWLGVLVAARHRPLRRTARASDAPAVTGAAGAAAAPEAPRPIWDAPAHWLRPAEGWWTTGES